MINAHTKKEFSNKNTTKNNSTHTHKKNQEQSQILETQEYDTRRIKYKIIKQNIAIYAKKQKCTKYSVIKE